jgi:hypothetical protein
MIAFFSVASMGSYEYLKMMRNKGIQSVITGLALVA